MRPLFSFFGSKWRSAPRYPAPRYDTIVEPFAGSAGYSSRHYERAVVLVEKDPTVASLWRWLITVPGATVAALPLVGAREDTRDMDLCEEARSLIGFWLNHGTERPCRTPSAWMRDGKHTNSYWGERIRDRVARQVEMIRHWRVIEGDYSQAPNDLATWFIDPPYQMAGTKYRCSSKDIDFAALGLWSRERSGQVIVCENVGASWLPFRPYLSSKAMTGKRRSGKSEEAIWLNDVETEEALRGLSHL